ASSAHSTSSPATSTSVPCTRALWPALVFGTKNFSPAIFTWASLASSLISIQQPICWHTAVTVPVVTNDLPLYAVGSLTTRASATVSAPAAIGAPRWFAAVLSPSFEARVQPEARTRTKARAVRMGEVYHAIIESLAPKLKSPAPTRRQL